MSTRPPNIIVGILDCARAKSFGLSGGERVARTPSIDALARRGTSFPKAVAPANWTVPSHMSIMTGSYPNVHLRRTFARGEAPLETFASWLRRQEYETALYSEMVHLSAGYGLEDGYSITRSRRMGVSDDDRTLTNKLTPHLSFLYGPGVRTLVERVPPFIVPMNAVNHPQEVAYKKEVCGDYLLEDLDAWLSSRSAEKPFHLFFNFVNAHEPYELVPNGHPPTFLGRWYARTPRYYLLAVRGLQGHVPWRALEGGYLRSIEQADAKIGRLWEILAKHGEAGRTLFALTGDHGQSFGEGGNVYHGCGATDSITRVPLLVVPPEGQSLPSRVERWTSLTEISSWVRAAGSGEVPFDENGHAPFPFSASAPDDAIVYCEGGPASDPNRSLRGINPDQSWNHRLLAAYRGDAKYVLDLDTDQVVRWVQGGDPDHLPPEVPDATTMRAWRQEIFADYEARDRQARVGGATVGALDVSLDARLKSWGYD